MEEGWFGRDLPMTLLEREEALETLTEAMASAAASRGRVVLVEGEAGIGKTALLRAMGDMAKVDGFRVLRARAAELERDFPHGLIRQLFERLVRRAPDVERDSLLSGAAALAAPVLGLADDRAKPGDPSYAANHGLYWLTVELADRSPLCLLVDDLHWSDSASLAFFDYLARRVDELPVLLVGALRPAEPGVDRAGLQGLRSAAGCVVVTPGLLSPAATAQIVARMTSADPSEDVCAVVHDLTRGNPFFVEELLRAADGPDIDADALRSLAPPSIAEAVLGRLSRLWPEALAVSRAVAVLDADAEPRHVTEVADLPPGQTARAVDALVRANILHADRRLRFLHPILRRAVYDDLPPMSRAALHRRAARALAAGGDPDRAAVHLLSVLPGSDPCAVECLRGAARRALGRGAPAAAARLLRRAIDEPPIDTELHRIFFEAGHAARLAGEPDCVALFEKAMESDDSLIVVEAAEELGLVAAWFGDLAKGLEILDDAASRVQADQELWLRLQAARLMIGGFYDDAAGDARRTLAEVIPLASAETRTGRLLLSASLVHAVYGFWMPDTEMLRLGRTLDSDKFIEETSTVGPPWMGVVAGLGMSEDTDLVFGYLDRVLAHATTTGSRTDLATYWFMRARFHSVYGELHKVEETVSRALEIAPTIAPSLRYNAAAMLAGALLERGMAEAAEATLRDLQVLDGTLAPYAAARCLLAVRARLHAARGRHEAALHDAHELARRGRAFDRSYLSMGSLWSSTLALQIAGAPADEVVDEAAWELAGAHARGTSSTIGLGLLVSGVAAGGDVDRFCEASGRLESSPRRLDHAIALVEYGAALRRANQRAAAREPLAQGMDIAHRLDARPLVERARQELLATGARPRRIVVTGADALTASERRVAAMAVQGMSNTEIAQTLFVTRKTVEKHLGGAFLKLAISSREELSQALNLE